MACDILCLLKCSVQCFSSVTQSCTTFCKPTDCSMPGFPVHHQPQELAQTHVHRVCDVIPPFHPLFSPTPSAFTFSQHQGLFQWVISHQVAEVSEFQLQHQSFQWTPMTDWSPLGWTGWASLQFKGLSRVFSNTTVQKYQFFSAQPSLWFNFHIHTWQQWWFSR